MPHDGRRFASRVALVTGGGRGIGRAIALALAAEGARVTVVARTSSHCLLSDKASYISGAALLVDGRMAA